MPLSLPQAHMFVLVLVGATALTALILSHERMVQRLWDLAVQEFPHISDIDAGRNRSSHGSAGTLNVPHKALTQEFCFWLHGLRSNHEVKRLMESIQQTYPRSKIVIHSDDGDSFERERDVFGASVFIAKVRQNQDRVRPPHNFECHEYIRRISEASQECLRHGATWIVAMEDDCLVANVAKTSPPHDATYAIINSWGGQSGLRARTRSWNGTKIASLMIEYESSFLKMGGWGMAGGTTYKIKPLQRAIAAHDWKSIGPMFPVQDMCMPQVVVLGNMTFGVWGEIMDAGRDAARAGRCTACVQARQRTCNCSNALSFLHSSSVPWLSRLLCGGSCCACTSPAAAACWRGHVCDECPFIVHGGSRSVASLHCTAT